MAQWQDPPDSNIGGQTGEVGGTLGAHAITKFHAGGQCPHIILQQQVNGKAAWSGQLLKSMLASKQTLNERRSLSLVYTVTLTFARRKKEESWE